MGTGRINNDVRSHDGHACIWTRTYGYTHNTYTRHISRNARRNELLRNFGPRTLDLSSSLFRLRLFLLCLLFARLQDGLLCLLFITATIHKLCLPSCSCLFFTMYMLSSRNRNVS
jgi:hypothetical protein